MAINNISSSLNGLSSNTGSSKTTKQTSASESGRSSVSSGSVAQDSVKLTEQAQSLGSLQQKITDSPDTDDNKVASIKAAIDSGDYKINSDRIASKMLTQENALFGDNK
jgi:negative regulator of flagellin synthesis FlgM